VFSLGSSLSGLLGERGVVEDGLVDVLVECFALGNLVGLETLVPLAELFHVLFVVFLQSFHVVVHMHSMDSVSVHLSIIRLVLSILDIPGELVGTMGDVESSIAGSLQDSEHFVTGGGVD